MSGGIDMSACVLGCLFCLSFVCVCGFADMCVLCVFVLEVSCVCVFVVCVFVYVCLNMCTYCVCEHLHVDVFLFICNVSTCNHIIFPVRLLIYYYYII